jgi:uncharacterized membrane protein
MTMPSLVLGSPQWLAVTLALMSVAVIALAWSYTRTGSKASVRICCAILKALGFAALGLCLLEPLLTGLKPRKGANLFLVVGDNSQSLQIRDGGANKSRGDWVREALDDNATWRTQLGREYDVRSYTFDTHLRVVEHFKGMNFEGLSSSLTPSLAALARRYKGLPVAGILLFSDGNDTAPGDLDWSQLPPIYPVLLPTRPAIQDIGVTRVTVSQTNFETAPVVLQAEVAATGFKDHTIVAVVVDEAGKEAERLEARPSGDRETLNFRFQLRPEKPGVSFYRVKAFAHEKKEEGAEDEKAPEGDTKKEAKEQTRANNSRLVVVDRGGGPYRVLYVSGRPNWEFKYLRRSLAEDLEVQLVGLIRIARRKPKFDFGALKASPNSPLFKGFDHPNADTAERRDQPVLVRLGTEDEAELRDGFPRTAEELYAYHAVILDDLESGFFTQDQLTLLRNFVSHRGGGFLMLGGPDSLAEGGYDRTPVGDLVPVYLDRLDERATSQQYRLALTREGWLQPWVRTQQTEAGEQKRLAAMASFQTLNEVGPIKPGASVLAQVRDSAGQNYPALVAQPYGRGRTAALLVGDLWRWGLQRENPEEEDFERSWRQMIRWLVADVPQRVEVTARSDANPTTPAIHLTTQVLDLEYLPLDNANVEIRVMQPNQEAVTLTAEPDSREAGLYVARYVPREAGPYRAVATVKALDGSAVGKQEAGWASQPEADEFSRVEPNQTFLETLASRTGGELVPGDNLESFVASLSHREAPIKETWIVPLWHHAFYFLITILCLAAEWGLRRTNGLP